MKRRGAKRTERRGDEGRAWRGRAQERRGVERDEK